jgi:pimeloyl-ACP methyl ester carboxylesterase
VTRLVHPHRIDTDRLTVGLLDTAADPFDDPRPVVVAVHGNCSSGAFFSDLLGGLPSGLRGLAPDLRGFGATDPEPIDATRGMRDFSDDLAGLLDTLGIEHVAFLAHSAGAGVALQFALDHPARVACLVLEAPMSPYGFGGTKGVDGTVCFDDHAGSGGGTANPDFAALIAAGDRTADDPASPRTIVRAFYVHPSCTLADEDAVVDSVLTTRIGDDHYPGTTSESPNWPGVAPGDRGMNNAFSPRHFDVSGFAELSSQPPVLWLRGADDLIVSDTSMFDVANLGALGAVPGWPGAEVMPPQPMVAQMRAVLDRYAARGGVVREEVLAETGHSPHLERPEEVAALVVPFLEEALA